MIREREWEEEKCRLVRELRVPVVLLHAAMPVRSITRGKFFGFFRGRRESICLFFKFFVTPRGSISKKFRRPFLTSSACRFHLDSRPRTNTNTHTHYPKMISWNRSAGSVEKKWSWTKERTLVYTNHRRHAFIYQNTWSTSLIRLPLKDVLTPPPPRGNLEACAGTEVFKH